MSKPNIQEELNNKSFPVVCWECNDEFFEGTLEEIAKWADKSDNGGDVNYDELEEGVVGCHCYSCSYAYHL